MVHQPMKPPTVVKLANQLNTVAVPLEMVIKVKREGNDYPYTCSVYGPLYPDQNKTHTESDGNQRKTTLRDSTEDFWSLATDRKTVQDTRGRVQKTAAG